MLNNSPMVPIIPIISVDDAKAFYSETLGLEFIRQEPQALVFRCKGSLLRMQIVDDMPASAGSVLGWEVEDIDGKIRELSGAGIGFEKYEGLPQDDAGIMTFTNGDRVAWFKDPDGNILSIAQVA